MSSFYEDFKKKKEQNSSKSAKASDVVKVTPTKAVNKQTQTVTKTLPKATKVTTSKQTAQKKAQQQRERAAALGLDSSDLSPLSLLKRDAVTGTTKDKITYAKTSGLAGKRSAAEIADWKKKGSEEAAARNKKNAAQTLSKWDRKLSSREQNLIRDAKTSYDEAREKGDRAGMEAAHKRAEAVRKGHGYSGGTTGGEYRSPELSFEEKVLLNQDGQERLKMARLNLEAAQAAGNGNGIAAAERAVKRILETDAFRNEETKKLSGFVTGHGQTVDRKPLTLEEFKEGEKKFNEGLYSVMAAVPGSILSLVETSNQAIENSIREKNRDYIDRKANELDSLRARLALAKRGEGNPAWGTVEQLEQRIKIAENLEKLRSSGRTVDPNLPGQTLMRKSAESRQKFMEGRTGVDRLLASAGLSMAQMVPALAASAIPGVGPAVGAGIMGAQAAGSKAYELNERGVSPAEAQMRGIVSGGIEALTEKIPISNLLKVVKAGGGASLVKTMAKQAGIEAMEESISYALNHAADVAYKDPEAKFSMNDLLESAAVGAISGGTLGGVGSVVGSKLSHGQAQDTAQPSRLDGAIQSAGNKIADKASFVLLKASGLKDRFSTHAETPQNAAEDAPAPTAEDIPVQEEAAQQAEEPQVDRATERVDRNLVNVIHQNKSVIDEAGVLARLTGNEFSQSKGKRLTDQVAEFFASLGNKVTRLGFGDVALTRRGAKDSIMHGVGRNKAIAFSAVPSVIENGVVIDEQADWKGRGYDSITFGGKIQIGNETYDMGVVVRKYGGENPNAGRYYLHEVVLTSEDGASVPIKTGTLAGNPSDTETPSSINHSIPQNAENVNADHIDNIIPFPEGMGAASRGFDPYTHTINEYGAIEPGEYPARIVDVPQSTDGQNRVRRWARTAMEAEATTEDTIRALERNIINNGFSYKVKKDKESLERAVSVIENYGLDPALAQWQEVVDGRRSASKDDIVLAETLYINAERTGNRELAQKLAAEIAAEGTRMGQGVQALRLLKKATKEGKVYYIRKSVEYVKQELRGRMGDRAQNIILDDALVQDFMNAHGKTEEDAALDSIYGSVAKQIPPTLNDRITAWRYFAMLGNPRTHIKNIVGNVIFGSVLKGSNKVSALIQRAALAQDQRTRSVFTDQAAKDFAKQDFEEMKTTLSGDKYDSAYTEIQRRVQNNSLGIFNKPAQFSSNAMNTEDMWAKKSAYIRSMAEFITAKGWDANNLTNEQVETARTQAVKDAQRATFQEASDLAKTLTQLEKKGPAWNLAIGGIMPFKGVPINIAKQGFNLSPAGLLKSLSYDLYKVKKGERTAAEAIDHISQGLTGTSIAAVGAFLAAQGILLSGGSDDEKERLLEASQGSQEYALRLGDYTYTIDWAAPAVLPLFVGAEMWNTIKGERDDDTGVLEASFDALIRLFEPMMNMTVLSGISDTIRSAAYSQDNALSAIGVNTLENFAGQFVPTLLGQVARTVDDTRRSTYIDRSSEIPDSWQKFGQKQANKIPGLSQQNVPYLNVWGEEDKTENPLMRAFENFISPGYIAKYEESDMTEELKRLNQAGYDNVLLNALDKYKSVDLDGDKEPERLDRDQWEAWQRTQGQTAKNALLEAIGGVEYQNMGDADRAEYVSTILDYSKSAGKLAAGGTEDTVDSWINKTRGLEENTGIGVSALLEARTKAKIYKGESSEEKTANYVDFVSYLAGKGYTQEQQDAISEAYYEPSERAEGYAAAVQSGKVSNELLKEFLSFSSSYNEDGEGALTQKEVAKALRDMDITNAERLALYATHGWKTSYSAALKKK